MALIGFSSSLKGVGLETADEVRKGSEKKSNCRRYESKGQILKKYLW